MIGTMVRDICDDSPLPQVGIVTCSLDEDRVMVSWFDFFTEEQLPEIEENLDQLVPWNSRA